MIAEQIGLGVLLRWKDKASREMKMAKKNVDGLTGSMDEATKSTQKLQKGYANLAKVGAGITALGVAGAAGIYSAVKAASTFQDALTATMSMTGLTGKAYDDMARKLSSAATTMSMQFGESAVDIMKSFYDVLSSGAKAGTEQFMALSESALKMAKVVKMEPAVAVKALSDVLHAFEMDATRASEAADVLFKASMLGATNVPELTEAMKTAAPTAAFLKISLADTAAVLTGFASKGVRASEAGTAFRMVMTKLIKPEGDAAKALNKLTRIYDPTTKKMRPMITILQEMKTGLARMTEETKASTLKAIAGERAFSKLGGLLESDLTILAGWSGELKKGGVLQAAFDKKMGTLSERIGLVGIAFENLRKMIGDHLLPIFSKITDAVTWVISSITDFGMAHPILTKIAVIFGAVATAAALVLGPIIMMAGIVGMLGGLPVILGAISAGLVGIGAAAIVIAIPLIKIAAVVAVLVGVGYALYKAWQSNFLGIKTVIMAVGKVVWAFYKGVWEGIKTAFTPLIGTFKETWAALKEAFAPLAEAVSEIFGFMGATEASGSTLETFKKVAQTVGKVIGVFIVTPLRIVITSVSYVVKAFAWLVSSLATTRDSIAGIFGTIRDSISGTLDWVWDKITWIVTKIPDFLLPAGLKGFAVPKPTPIGGQTVVPATAPAVQRAVPRPTIPREAAIPAMAMAGVGGGGGSYDQSTRIEPGAVVIYANKIDEAFAAQLDTELSKIIERRRERQ